MRGPALIAVILASTSCGSGPAPSTLDATPSPRAAHVVSGPIAARVNGEPIGLDEVEATARATGLAPIDALHRLEQERVLLAHIEPSVHDAEVDDAVRRASVQALLRDRVERTVDDASISEAEIAARYQAQRASWARPERRASVHVLCRPRDADATAAAERFVRAAIDRLSHASDPVAEADAIGAEASAGRTFEVRVEHIPAVERRGPLAAPYLAALFDLAAPGAVTPAPVTTTFGLHAIVLTSIEPSFVVSIEEATPILRRQLVAEHRAAALDALCADIAARTPITIDEPRARVVVAQDLGGAP